VRGLWTAVHFLEIQYIIEIHINNGDLKFEFYTDTNSCKSTVDLHHQPAAAQNYSQLKTAKT
jgi:hypothetical protein